MQTPEEYELNISKMKAIDVSHAEKFRKDMQLNIHLKDMDFFFSAIYSSAVKNFQDGKIKMTK